LAVGAIEELDTILVATAGGLVLVAVVLLLLEVAALSVLVLLISVPALPVLGAITNGVLPSMFSAALLLVGEVLGGF
jgi:hypothetical protein